MRIIKHFYRVSKALLRSFTCKHEESYTASCPYTGKTYVTCTHCLTRVNEFETGQ